MDESWRAFGMGTEGVFGAAIGVSTSMVFLLVRFSAVLERPGAGLDFIRSSSRIQD
ncbi:hypothetical protein [Puniceicoccus vermicola]|uniref:Uncharacterized protein n=1 Tax=Puniceicoccus vermicola TaxID=388746 RepID=A0A7X1E3Q1_9BACT|nr:hypothetical protein [Puniceicoccus vermicola]MBC2601296.1 hypothetical protein [Puniceicoccus vermicola]